MANWFIALSDSGHEWLRRVPAPGAGVRSFVSDDLHMTVAFLGAVTAEKAHDCFEAARAIPLKALDAKLGEVQPMGHPRHASALSALLDVDDAASRELGDARDLLLARAGARTDTRPLLPHVTLARITRGASSDERRRALAWASALDLGRSRVRLTRLALYTRSADRATRLFDIVDTMELDS